MVVHVQGAGPVARAHALRRGLPALRGCDDRRGPLRLGTAPRAVRAAGGPPALTPRCPELRGQSDGVRNVFERGVYKHH